MERCGGSAQLYQGDSHVSAGWLTDDRSRLKDTLCSHFPSSKIVNLWRFKFQLEPITISREVFRAITEPGVTVPATGSHWQPLLPSLNKERLRQMSAQFSPPVITQSAVIHSISSNYITEALTYIYIYVICTTINVLTY